MISTNFYSIPFRGTTMFLTQEATPYGQWRAALPGVGGSATYALGAISEVLAMWQGHGKPTEFTYVGPKTEPLTLERLLDLAQPWERSLITAAFNSEFAP